MTRVKPMHDIQDAADIKLLVDKFYEKVVDDDVIGYIFRDIVAFSWHTHLPIMYSFWNSILLNESDYKGNPMLKHLEIDQKSRLSKEHFDRWLQLWEETVNENFAGEKAREAISRGKSIGQLMMYKIDQKRNQ